jgi:hypothetical protein
MTAVAKAGVFIEYKEQHNKNRGKTMQEIDFYLVDAFSDTAFGGNPAAVCPLKEWLPDETLLKMAQQHNQSETAFLCAARAASNFAGSPR